MNSEEKSVSAQVLNIYLPEIFDEFKEDDQMLIEVFEREENYIPVTTLSKQQGCRQNNCGFWPAYRISRKNLFLWNNKKLGIDGETTTVKFKINDFKQLSGDHTTLSGLSPKLNIPAVLDQSCTGQSLNN